MYEVGLEKGFMAWHVMPDMDGPEGELHSHEYRLDVVVSRPRLDERGMVCDLDVLESALGEIVGVVADQNLEVIKPPDAAAVTVEILAQWAHRELAARLATQLETEPAPDIELSVRVWESPVAFGGYSAPIKSS
jgi:6-pyruvoyltetrahydropterin/6-carboxytetrahydropterin synthase